MNAPSAEKIFPGIEHLSMVARRRPASANIEPFKSIVIGPVSNRMLVVKEYEE